MATTGIRQNADARRSTVTAVWDRSSSGQRVATHLRSLLYEGALRSGDRVPQDEIADALGCSRLPVREAIIALEHEGLLMIEPHRGAFVNPITRATFEDQFELFGSTLGIAVGCAARRGGAKFMAELNVALELLAGAKDLDGFALANDALQSLIITSAQSPRLRAVLRVLSGITPGNFFELVPGSRERQLAGIRAMVAAAVGGDLENAEIECRAMMRAQGDALIDLLSERGFFA